MMTRACVLLAVLSVGLSLACNDRGNPPPQFNEPLAAGEGGAGMLPIRLTKRDKASLTGSAGTSEGAATAGGGQGSAASGSGSSGGAETVTIDDSTPEALANTLVAILQAGSFAQLPEVVVPEQKDAVLESTTAAQLCFDAAAELKKTLDEKFPGHTIQLPDMAAQVRVVMKSITITDIKTIDDDNAEGTSHTETPSGDQTQTLKFKRIDGKWRYLSSQVEDGSMQKQVELLTKLTEGMKRVAQQVNDGEVADAKAANAELTKLTLEAAKEIMGGSGAPTSDAGTGDKPADAPADDKPAEPQKAKPKERQPDPLDGTMPGPGVLPRG